MQKFFLVAALAYSGIAAASAPNDVQAYEPPKMTAEYAIAILNSPNANLTEAQQTQLLQFVALEEADVAKPLRLPEDLGTDRIINPKKPGPTPEK